MAAVWKLRSARRCCGVLRRNRQCEGTTVGVAGTLRRPDGLLATSKKRIAHGYGDQVLEFGHSAIRQRTWRANDSDVALIADFRLSCRTPNRRMPLRPHRRHGWDCTRPAYRRPHR